MKFWSLQKKDIIEYTLANGFYQPDFRKSDYLQLLPNIWPTYNLVLTSFNVVNGIDLPGLVFGFLYSSGHSLYEFANIGEFRTVVREKRAAIKSMWSNLATEDARVVELEYEEQFNPILIDINDFNFLIPPVGFPPPYTPEDVGRLRKDLLNGVINTSIFPSGMIQAHMPYIRAENIRQTYEIFDLM